MSKILLIVDDIDSSRSGAIILRDLALSLNSNHNECIVLAPNDKIKTNIKISFKYGFKIVYFRNPTIKNINFVKRAVNEIVLSSNLLKTRALISDYSINGIIYYSPTIFFGFGIRKLKKLFNVKTYLILRDVFPNWVVEKGLIFRNGLIHNFFKIFENINYSSADKIGVMSDSIKNNFSHRKDFKKFEVLPTWVNIPKFSNFSKSYRKKLGLKNKLILFYGGNIGKAQSIKSLINIVNKYKNSSKIHFIFIGNGDESDSIKLLEKIQDNVTYFGEVNNKTYNEMVSSFDIGMFSLDKKLKISNYPGKVINYMSLRKPVIGIVNKGNEIKSLINDNNCGFIRDYEDDWEKEIISFIDYLTENRSQIKLIGMNGFKLVKEKFSTAFVKKRLLKFFNS